MTLHKDQALPLFLLYPSLSLISLLDCGAFILFKTLRPLSTRCLEKKEMGKFVAKSDQIPMLYFSALGREKLPRKQIPFFQL